MNHNDSPHPESNQPAKGFALAAFVCGLSSVALCWFPGGIAGLILSHQAKKRDNTSKLITVARITSIASFVLTVCIAVFGFVMVKRSLHYFNYGIWESDRSENAAIWGARKDLSEHLDIPSKYLGSQVDTIYYNAFSGEDEIVSVRIPEGVSRIQSCAFKDCPNLTTMELPSGIQYIEEQAFDTGSELTIRYSGTMAQWEQIEKHEQWRGSSASIPLRIVCEDGTVTLLEE